MLLSMIPLVGPALAQQISSGVYAVTVSKLIGHTSTNHHTFCYCEIIIRTQLVCLGSRGMNIPNGSNSLISEFTMLLMMVRYGCEMSYFGFLTPQPHNQIIHFITIKLTHLLHSFPSPSITFHHPLHPLFTP